MRATVSGQGGAGEEGVYVRLTQRLRSRCFLSGRPVLQPLDDDHPLAVKQARQTGRTRSDRIDFGGSGRPVVAVVLAGWTNYCGPGTRRTPVRVRITDQTTHTSVTASITPRGQSRLVLAGCTFGARRPSMIDPGAYSRPTGN
jgi:hypothetical protein